MKLPPSNKARIRIIDEVNCIVSGITDKQFAILKDRYSPFADGYFFSIKYKIGQWDGKISFFSKGGKTYVNLIEEIYPQLKEWGYSIDLIDNRSIYTLDLESIDKHYLSDAGIELGDHQVDAVNAIIAENGGIIEAATGAGKSIINACLTKLYTDNFDGFKMIVIVPNSDLIYQGVDDFKNLGLDVGEYSGDTKDLNHPIVISTWQALQNNPRIVNLFQGAIVDECHGVKGRILKELLNDYGSNLMVKIGVTGTLPTSPVDALSVKVTLGTVKYLITAKQLIDSGWLSKLMIYMLELVEDFKEEYKKWKEKFPDESEGFTYNDYMDRKLPEYDMEKKYLNNNERRIEWIKKLVELHRGRDKGNALILVNGHDVAKKLKAIIEGSHFVHGKDKKQARREIYDLFKDNDDVVVIATSQLASTGLNIPRIFYLFLIDIGKSSIRVVQSIGRGLRKAADKDYIEVFDITSNLKYSKQHQNQRIKIYKEREYPYEKKKINYTKD